MNQRNVAQVRQMSFNAYLADGFRLQKLEVYNWGTFDGKIWAYQPKGNTTLLTGESGSGKSTLVDALATILVSPRKIAYNKAADASARERTLTTYVRGYYGQKSAYEGKGNPEALRDHNQYTVLLATFTDSALNKNLTLAVFLWFREQQGNPSRFYVVAQNELSIAEHFGGFTGDIRQLKAAIRAYGAEVFDDYKYYAEYFRKFLGNLSPQAIDLFQQTVSMKKIELLTDFVRSHMLEETDIASEIEKLLEHYYSLNSAYEAVQRARKQTQLLAPVCDNGREYTRQNIELDELLKAEKAVAVWFATLKKDLFAEKIEELTIELTAAKAAAENARSKQDKLSAEVRRLEREIYDNGGGALEKLNEELVRLQEALGRKQKAFHRYLEYAQTLEFAQSETPEAFAENRRRIEDLRLMLPEKMNRADAELTDISVKLKETENEKRDIDEELESLKGRTSNIPKDLIALRKRMCAALQLGEEALPFAGELMEVTESELAWEGAIERLLHSFALSVLVSAEHYATVAKWVNEQNLGARLVYFSTGARPGIAPDVCPDAVAAKMLVKQHSPFTGWLTRELAERFNHICCPDITAFRREKRAISLTGQIKSAERHEKDDRRHLGDRTRYVLGFSNQKKIDTLEQKSKDLTRLITELQTRRGRASHAKNALIKQESALAELVQFIEFSEIDVRGARLECHACEQHIEQLSKQESDVLAALRERLAGTESQMKRQEALIRDAEKSEYGISIKLEDVMRRQRLCAVTLEAETPLEQLSYPYLEKNRALWLGDAALTLENGDAQERQYRERMNDKKSKLQSVVADLKAAIEKGMYSFMITYPLETRETDDKIASLPDYHRMYEQLIKDDLPRYEREFRDLLTSRVINQIALFQMTLKQQYDRVRERIESINRSMYNIDYNPSRYIRLNCEDSADAEIRVFRSQLKACTEGATGGFDDEGLATGRFLQIKDIITRFQGREKETESDKRWTKKVTDVRNWFVFSASERWRENDEEYEHYAHSDGKSGGQKEKLAYTILAASLVYNYGLHEDYLDYSTFRLVVIDEAFLRVSDSAAEYGLKLFEQLQFQLVIVTPLLKIPTIEPFIAHVGFVSHDDVAHQSSLIDIPIEVYKENQREYEKSAYV